MPTNPTLADIADPILLGGLGYFACSILSLAMIVLIEGTVLRLLRWGSWKIAFGHAFIINLVTSLIGTGLLISFKVEQFYQIPVPGLFIGAFLLTVIVETIELKVLRRSVSFSRVSLNSLLANIFSYAFLVPMIFLFDYHLHPHPSRYPRPRPAPTLYSPTPSPATSNWMNAKTLSSYRLPSVLGLAHGVSDGAAGLLLGSLATDAPATQITLLVLFYNALGFGAQPLIGYFAGGIRSPRTFASGGNGTFGS
jgi:hypothetical protein